MEEVRFNANGVLCKFAYAKPQIKIPAADCQAKADFGNGVG